MGRGKGMIATSSRSFPHFLSSEISECGKSVVPSSPSSPYVHGIWYLYGPCMVH